VIGLAWNIKDQILRGICRAGNKEIDGAGNPWFEADIRYQGWEDK